MNFDEYQKHIRDFAVYPKEVELQYLSLGLSGEAGEFANKVKKVFRDGRPISREDARDELGDVLWYVSMLAAHFSIPLSEVAEMNVEKLHSRAARGKLKGAGDRR